MREPDTKQYHPLSHNAALERLRMDWEAAQANGSSRSFVELMIYTAYLGQHVKDDTNVITEELEDVMQQLVLHVQNTPNLIKSAQCVLARMMFDDLVPAYFARGRDLHLFYTVLSFGMAGLTEGDAEVLNVIDQVAGSAVKAVTGVDVGSFSAADMVMGAPVYKHLFDPAWVTLCGDRIKTPVDAYHEIWCIRPQLLGVDILEAESLPSSAANSPIDF